jgi:hypothetical protein
MNAHDHFPRVLAALSCLIITPSAFSQVSIPNLRGLWEFNNSSNIGQATVGPNLGIVGTSPSHSASLNDGITGSLSGVITTVGGTANRLTVDHGIRPNGGGSFVNQYTLLFDIFSPAASRSAWRCLFQTNTSNANDGDYFIRNDNDRLGTASLTYSSSSLLEDRWQRVVISVDLGGESFRTYVNGSLFYAHSTTSSDLNVDARYSLDPRLLLFADDTGENASLNVATVAIWERALSATEASNLGGPTVQFIPEPSSALILCIGTLLLGARRNRRA